VKSRASSVWFIALSSTINTRLLSVSRRKSVVVIVIGGVVVIVVGVVGAVVVVVVVDGWVMLPHCTPNENVEPSPTADVTDTKPFINLASFLDM
jgi:hypothetical protein